MDCNREEALRAKQIAEKKMENKDFYGALKFAVRAQQLYPELENVSQLILVCEVHCSAEKYYGSDKDWYGILKIEPSADDLSIKKQYRKLALVLHPDKNKFSGSSDAFKLVGEAQRMLLDGEKRMIHDSKRRAFGNISKQPSRPSNIYQPWNQSNFAQGHSVDSQFKNNFTAGRSQYPQPRTQTGVSGNRATFWTVCPFCSVRYQFYKDSVLNKVVQCQSCKKSFTAYELNVHGAAAAAAAPGTNQSYQPPSFFQQKSVPSKGTEGANRSFTSKPVFERVNFQGKGHLKTQGSVDRKRKKKVEESSESDSDSESSETEEDVEEHIRSFDNANNTGQDFQQFGEQPRRSSRPKRNVSYNENPIDNDDDVTQSSKVKKSSTSPIRLGRRVVDSFWEEEVTKVYDEDHEEEVQEVDKESQQEEHGEPKSDDEGGETVNDDVEETEPEVYECPDPEFNDFDKYRKEGSFAVGQIWALYDTEDAMPRFYAYIRKVASSSFKLQITWLKPQPGNVDEEKWVEEELPVSCGKFRCEKKDRAEDLPMFSHMVTYEAHKGIFNIVPRKGETWAVFKNWSIKWSSSTHVDTRKYEYEFVEILSDYDDNVGVSVFYLEKVKGFTCLFSRKEGGENMIPMKDKYRFSHMVPSCRMSGEEREGVPKGSYELDPASLPASVIEQVL